MPASARSAAAAVDAFHAALSRGDTRAALDQLTDDVLVFEAGGVERNKAEYSAHHLAADAEFSKAVTATFTRRSGGSDGRFVWIASEGRTTGTFRGKVVDRSTAETMLLRRIGGNWKIAHIHWSSAAAKPSGPATAVPLLARSVPGNGATVRSPVDRLELHFAPPARLLEVIVAGPEGQMPMMVTAAGDQAHYSLPLAGLGAGTYSVDWRASAGGREDRGTFSFTVR
jgi:ketosteroid isomerase-like protein